MAQANELNRLDARRRRSNGIGDLDRREEEDERRQGPGPGSVHRFGRPRVDRDADREHAHFERVGDEGMVPQARAYLRPAGDQRQVGVVNQGIQQPVADDERADHDCAGDVARREAQESDDSGPDEHREQAV